MTTRKQRARAQRATPNTSPGRPRYLPGRFVEAPARRYPAGVLHFSGGMRHVIGEIKGPADETGVYVVATGAVFDGERTEVSYATCTPADMTGFRVDPERACAVIPELVEGWTG